MDIKKKYGIDTNLKLSPLMVRDALVECFYEAHCLDADIDSTSQNEAINKEYCKTLIKKVFSDSNLDFENPNKDTLKLVVGKLKDFAVNFRDKTIVDEHAQEIQSLINELD